MSFMYKRESNGETGPPKQKKKFDPQKVVEDVCEKLFLTNKLKFACEELTREANEVIQSSISTSVFQQLNYLVIIAILGHKGSKGFELATQLVPRSFGNLRTTRVCNINNFSWRDQPPITEAIVEKLLPVLIDQNKKMAFYSLIHLSEESSNVHIMFLEPPVKKCINSSCNQFGQGNSLSANQAPTDVVVFDFDGPLLASKICLKCISIVIPITTFSYVYTEYYWYNCHDRY